MIKGLPPPTEVEEYRNTAEILRDLAAQTQFGKPAANSLTVPTISNDWQPSPTTNLKLGFKRFARINASSF